jgi:putative MATE family efflux protein
MLVGIAATAMVGHISAEAVGAVGLANRVTQIVWAIFSAIGTGATVLVARSIGARDLESSKRVAQQALVLAISLVCVLAALVVWQAEGLMVGLFDARGDILALSFSYLSLAAWAMPFMAVMQVCGAIMRGAGNTRTPMMVAFVVNIINIAFSYSLIYGLGPFTAMGVRGAAAGAIIAQVCGAGLALFALSRPVGEISFRIFRAYIPDFKEIRRILNIGVPAAFEHIFWQGATIILMRLIVTFGAAELAAHQLGLTAESLSYMPSVGFGIAATAFVGQSLGAQKPEQAERYVRELVRFSMILTAFTASLLFFIPRVIMGWLTSDLAVIELGARYLMLMALVQLPQQMSGVLNGAMRGGGDTRAPMVIGGIGLWLIRLPFSFIFSLHFGLGITGVWLAMTVDLLIRFSMSSLRYLKGPWRTMKLT